MTEIPADARATKNYVHISATLDDGDVLVFDSRKYNIPDFTLKRIIPNGDFKIAFYLDGTDSSQYGKSVEFTETKNGEIVTIESEIVTGDMKITLENTSGVDNSDYILMGKLA